MAKGVGELREELRRQQCLSELPEIHQFLDGFYLSRIGIRILIGTGGWGVGAGSEQGGGATAAMVWACDGREEQQGQASGVMADTGRNGLDRGAVRWR